MSLVINNNNISSVDAKGLIALQRNSSQLSHAVLTGTSYTVGDELVLFINGSGAFTLTLPSASTNAGRNLFVVQRSGTNAISASPQIIDIDQDANGTSTQAALLAATAGHWAHLVSNGTYWVVVSKANASP
jgi:hypothetical protein